jgi:hypothetical protein
MYKAMSNEDNNYNGWRNYPTWRIQLEVVRDYVNQTTYDDAETAERWGKELSINELAVELENYVDEVVFQDGTFSREMTLAESYASAFIDSVDWYEIAEHARQVANEALTEGN